jgi:hypothetical protein
MEQTWPVELRAFYTPLSPVPEIPDLCDLLNQAPATLWQDASPPRPLVQTTLQYASDLVLRSGSSSTLLISPAG